MSRGSPRILMTTDAVGGVWTYATALAGALCRSGAAVCLVSMGPPPRPDQREALRDIDGLSLEVTGLALEWMDLAGADRARAREALTRVEARTAPDIVHLNGFREARYGFAAPVLVVAHSCVASWWRACRGDRPLGVEWHTYMDNATRGLAAADAWVAPTTAFRDWIEAAYAPPRAGRTIWNGCAHPAAAPAKQPCVLAAGRLWDEAKNLDALCAAAPALDWPVRIAGPTRAPGQENGARFDSVEPLGELPHAQLVAEMQRAAIFVSPARYEPFGLSILEAAGCGCALVLSDIPSLRELWDGAALFFDPGEPGALAEALKAVETHGRLCGRLQDAARRRAARYSLDAMAASYLSLYAEMLDPVHRPDVGKAPALEVPA